MYGELDADRRPPTDTKPSASGQPAHRRPPVGVSERTPSTVGRRSGAVAPRPTPRTDYRGGSWGEGGGIGLQENLTEIAELRKENMYTKYVL